MSSLKNTIDFEIILPDFEFWCEFSQRITILRCMNDRIERDLLHEYQQRFLKSVLGVSILLFICMRILGDRLLKAQLIQ